MSSNQKTRNNIKAGRQNSKQNNRNRNQVGRSRKGSGKKQVQQPLTANKQIDSHGPAGKLRGNVKQLYDKYKILAHENRTKDRTDSEAYGQYAHHYYTLYSEFAAAEAAQQLEHEKEKERRMQEAAEDQSNIVSMLDSGEMENDTDSQSMYDDENEPEEAETEIPKKGTVKRKTTRSRKKTEDTSPELPLEDVPTKEISAKPKRTRKKVEQAEKVVKEEVAE